MKQGMFAVLVVLLLPQVGFAEPGDPQDVAQKEVKALRAQVQKYARAKKMYAEGRGVFTFPNNVEDVPENSRIIAESFRIKEMETLARLQEVVQVTSTMTPAVRDRGPGQGSGPSKKAVAQANTGAHGTVAQEMISTETRSKLSSIPADLLNQPAALAAVPVAVPFSPMIIAPRTAVPVPVPYSPESSVRAAN